MRLQKTSDSFVLEEMTPFELALLAGVPEAADPNGSDKAAGRLYPTPLTAKAQNDDAERAAAFLKDWKEFVQPGLEDRFQGHLAAFFDDLGLAREISASPPAPNKIGLEEPSVERGPTFELTLPDAHAEHWFSALNQARLVLSQRYELDSEEAEEDLMEQIIQSTDDPTVDEAGRELLEDRWRALIKCQVYGGLQQWLLQEVMS